jgi:hypothetical protein
MQHQVNKYKYSPGLRSTCNSDHFIATSSHRRYSTGDN